MSNTWKLSEATIDLKKGKYVVLYDTEDPRNNDDPNGGKQIICVIAPADKMDDIDLQNAAILKEAKSMLVTLLKVRDVLEKNRCMSETIRAKDAVNLINTTLKKINKL
jgi:hypothetical protein